MTTDSWSRQIWLAVCLAALAVQGMTPDAHDLSSSLLTRIFWTIVADPGSPGSFAPFRGLVPRGDTPEDDPSADESPDEALTLASVRVSPRVPSPEPVVSRDPAARLARQDPGGALPAGRGFRAPSRRRGLLLDHCRLTC